MSSFLLYLFISFFIQVESKDCPEIQLEYTVQQFKSSYQILLKENGGLAPYSYALFNENGRSVNKDFRFKSNKIKIDEKGVYHAVVYDKNGCSGKVKLEIN